MTTKIQSSDIVLWLRVRRPHPDLRASDWGASPLRSVIDDANETDLLSFGADEILVNEETLSSFLRALTELRSLSDATVVASVAIYFDQAKVMQNFLLPSDFMRAMGDKLDEVEISVYSTNSTGSTDAAPDAKTSN